MKNNMNKKIFWCSSCLAMSTRNRISFDSKGRCNACLWAERKKNLDWSSREKQLKKLLDKHRSKDKSFDCLVPVSGGKDGSYVAYNLKYKYGMNPLSITVNPPLPLEIGERNLKNFINSGYSHIAASAEPRTMQFLNKNGFIDKGFPYFGWLMAIQTIPVRFAVNLGINLIFYGEDGEVEYGGTTKTTDQFLYDVNYMKEIYLESGYDQRIKNAKDAGLEGLDFFTFPEENTQRLSKLEITHWSYFENWDPYRNYLTAKKFCGLTEAEENNSGTFTNFAQNDQALYALHTYLMYLKFGFGRANQDACIEIRRGAMERFQAVNLVNLYDGEYPEKFIDLYLNYYEMNIEEFNEVLDKWANKDLFFKENDRWQPNFLVN